MGRAGLRGKLVEAFKFAVYLSIPVGVTIASIQPENLEWIIRNRQYVVYPKENKRPPTVREPRARPENRRAPPDNAPRASALRARTARPPLTPAPLPLPPGRRAQGDDFYEHMRTMKESKSK